MNDGYFSVAIPAGSYDLQVVPNEFREPAVIDETGFEVEAGQSYLVAVVGSADAPSEYQRGSAAGGP